MKVCPTHCLDSGLLAFIALGMPLILKLMSSSAVVQRPRGAQQRMFCVFLCFSQIQPQQLSPFIRHIGTSVSYSLNIELHLHSVLSHCHLPLYYLTLLTLSAPLPMTYFPVVGLSHFPLFGITFSSATRWKSSSPFSPWIPFLSASLFLSMLSSSS